MGKVLHNTRLRTRILALMLVLSLFFLMGTGYGFAMDITLDLIDSEPAKGAVDVSVDIPEITLTFDKNVWDPDEDRIYLWDTTDHPADVRFADYDLFVRDGNILVLELTQNLAPEAEYTLQLEGGAVMYKGFMDQDQPSPVFPVRTFYTGEAAPDPDPEEFTLTVAIGEGEGETDPPPGDYDYPEGEEVTLTATANEGYVFDRWEVNGDEGFDEVITITMNSNKTATAYFTQAPDPDPEVFILTVAIGEGEGETDPAPGDHDYPEGEEVTLTATAVEGCVFSKWEVNGDEDFDEVITITMNSNKTATAYFTQAPDQDPEEFTLTVSIAEGEGVTDPLEGEHNYDPGETVNLMAEPDPGWRFVKWVVDGDDYVWPQYSQDITMDSDKLAAAHFDTRLKGDVNGDGNITSCDLTLAVDIVLGRGEDEDFPTPAQSWAADINDDGKINIIDLIAIVHLILSQKQPQ